MRRYGLLLICAMLAALASVVSAERIEVPCGEHERVTGQKICDTVPVVRW